MTARFTGPLDLREIGYEVWRVLAPFAFHSHEHECTVHVPAGFVTDLASVPAIARGFVPKIGYWSQAAVVHDILYQQHSGNIAYKLPTSVGAGYNPAELDIYSSRVKGFVMTRAIADDLLKEGADLKAKEYNINPFQERTNIIYTAVRIGGANSWYSEQEKKDRQAIIDAGEDYLE